MRTENFNRHNTIHGSGATPAVLPSIFFNRVACDFVCLCHNGKLGECPSQERCTNRAELSG